MGFRSQFESLIETAKRWGSLADFYMVYGREAFPAESRWPSPVPDMKPVTSPTTLEQRLLLVERFAEGIGDELPILVDEMSDRMMADYDAYPFRVYAISTDGRVAVESEKGAAGFGPTLERIEQWLRVGAPEPGSL